MKYAIVYSSRTGNTGMLAERLKETMDGLRGQENGEDRAAECVYFGQPGEEAEKKTEEADVVFAGFWTDKGTCDETMADFLQTVHGKRVFLFGTAGFGEGEAYFSAVLDRVKTHLDETNVCVGTWMCQGKMPSSVRKRYEAMRAQNPGRAEMLIRNFDRALSHPDEQDLSGLSASALIIFP